MNAKEILTAVIALAAIVFFAYAIIKAIHYSNLGTPGSMPSFLNQAIIVIGGVLATNLGSVVGIEVDQVAGNAFGFQEFSTDLIMGIRIACASLYVLAMIIVFIFWAKLGFKNNPNEIVDSLPLLSKTLLGVAVGALAVFLGT